MRVALGILVGDAGSFADVCRCSGFLSNIRRDHRPGHGFKRRGRREAAVGLTNVSTNAVRTTTQHRDGRLQLSVGSARHVQRQGRTAGIQDGIKQQCRSAGAADGAPGFHAAGRPGYRIRRGSGERRSAAGGKRHRGHRDRKQGHRRAAAQRPQVSESGGAGAQRQHAFARRPDRPARARAATAPTSRSPSPASASCSTTSRSMA